MAGVGAEVIKTLELATESLKKTSKGRYGRSGLFHS